jgi:hypothetical protein
VQRAGRGPRARQRDDAGARGPAGRRTFRPRVRTDAVAGAAHGQRRRSRQ